LRQGDHQVPEGLYRVTALNPKSNFHLSLRLDYPNQLDRAHAEAEQRLRLGGDIMIHGGAASDGCLAVGDEAAEELFALGRRVGAEHVSVIISPVDLRTVEVARALARVHSPAPWLEQHYLSIARELQGFPVPDSAKSSALTRRPIARRATCKPHDLGDCSRRCAKGEGSSCARAGVMYRDGRGVAVDSAKAWSLLGDACGAGDAFGCAELSRLYLTDDGTRRDVARAADLARAACDGGDGHGCAYLAAICVDGLLYPEPLEVCSLESVDRMRRRAVELLDTRCKGWGAYDCATLATIYADGDLATARRFASGACDGGEPEGCSELHRFTDTARLVAFRTASDRCTAPEGRRDHDRDRRSRLD